MPHDNGYTAAQQHMADDFAGTSLPMLGRNIEEELETASTTRSFTYESPPRSYERRHHHWVSSPFWSVATFVLLAILIIQNAIYIARSTYLSGFATELSALKSHVEMHQTRFLGAIRETLDGNLTVTEPAVDSKGRRFTGIPSPEIEEAWHDLIFGRYVSLTPTEVSFLNADNHISPLTFTNISIPGTIEPGFYGGPDMLHSLHCLNGLRKHTFWDYEHYKDSMEIPEWGRRMHVDHCIEQLRQAVLCHGDLTPVTLKPIRMRTEEGAKGESWALLGETERQHTCRDGVALAKEWQRLGGERGFFAAA